jgi:hypothetical protein
VHLQLLAPFARRWRFGDRVGERRELERISQLERGLQRWFERWLERRLQRELERCHEQRRR